MIQRKNCHADKGEGVVGALINVGIAVGIMFFLYAMLMSYMDKNNQEALEDIISSMDYTVIQVNGIEGSNSRALLREKDGTVITVQFDGKPENIKDIVVYEKNVPTVTLDAYEDTDKS